MARNKLSCGRILLLILLASTVEAAAQGPLQVQNRFPLHLIFLTPKPSDARLPGPGTLHSSLSIDYNSVYLNERSDRWSALIDMEMAVVDLFLAYGVSRSFAMSVQLPLVSMNSGFLDGFLEDYHDAFGFSNYGREARPKNSFAYAMRKDGRSWIEGGTDDFGWADMTVSGQMHLFELNRSGSWAGSLLASIKVPIGEETNGYGSGRFDAGLFLPTQWVGERWAFHLMPGFIWHEDPETSGVSVSAQNSYSLFGGIAYSAGPRWRWYAQLNYFSTPLEETGLSILDDGAVELTLGFRYAVDDHLSIQLAFCEDLFTQAAPDFNLHLGVTWSPAMASGR